MNYSDLIYDYIKKSGLSLAEITRRLQEEKNIKIDRSYLSKLKNDPKYPATDEVNRAIAEITGGDPKTLVMAGYRERAPIEIKEVLDKTISYERLLKGILENRNCDKKTKDQLEKLTNLAPYELDELLNKILNDIELDSFLNIYKSTNSFNQFNNDEKDLIKLKKIRESQNISISQMAKQLGMTEDEYQKFEQFGGIQSDKEAIRKVNDLYKKTINELENKISEESVGYKISKEYHIENNDMSGDRIMKGDEVIISVQDSITEKDIALVSINNEQEVLRRVKQVGKNCMLTPSNPHIQPELIPCEDIKIIGKVVEVKFKL
ncbi:S24 family peptidase [Chengkuizengella marina]|nr:XRE family transcriptional regulator [Chengkuizengella marina]